MQFTFVWYCWHSPHKASSVFRINCPAWWQSLLHLVAAFHCFVPFIGCQYGLEYFLTSVCWSTKPCVKNSLFVFTPCLPYHFHSVHWDQTTIIVCQSLGSTPTQVQELFTLVELCATLWNNRPLSVRSVISVPTFKKYLNTHLFDLAFPHRYRWPVDVMELFPRFCCSTLIRLSRHWAWLCRDIGAWKFAWLIE